MYINCCSGRCNQIISVVKNTFVLIFIALACAFSPILFAMQNNYFPFQVRLQRDWWELVIIYLLMSIEVVSSTGESHNSNRACSDTAPVSIPTLLLSICKTETTLLTQWHNKHHKFTANIDILFICLVLKHHMLQWIISLHSYNEVRCIPPACVIMHTILLI